MDDPAPDTDPESTDRTFAFVDLAGFTALTEVHGDRAAVEQVEHFVSLTRDSLSAGGHLVKSLGDAVMLCFDSPDHALHAVGALLAACTDTTNLPLPRTGLHHGPALARGNDWFGASVNLAARVAAQAQGGQTLATTAVANAARRRSIPVIDLGCFSLRNIAQPVELFELALVEPTTAVSTDPVCRMQVRHPAAAGRLRHAEHDYWFCSFGCIHRFVQSPDDFTT